MSSTSSSFLYGGNVHANGIRQHYLRYGGTEGERAQRDAVILIPGITSPAVTWGFVAEHLGRQFDTYVLDVRGRGLSSSGPGLDYGLDAQAADVAAFAQALGLQRWALLGHSMGGRIAVRAARSQPAGLTRLVVVDPPVSAATTSMPTCPASSCPCCWSRPSAATWCAARTWPSGRAWRPRPRMCACPMPAT
jgi:N-formylmaleamate deformylase